MILKRTRTIKFYDLHATVTLSEGRAGMAVPARSVDLWRILKAGHSLVSDGTFRMEVEGKHAEIRVQDTKLAKTSDGSEAVVMLIARADKSTADQAVYNLQDRRQRVDRKGPTEGADFSAHLVLVSPPSPDRQTAALLEGITGLPTGTVLHVLNQIIKTLEVRQPDLFRVANNWGECNLDGRPTMYRSTLALSFTGHLSRDVTDSLSGVHAVTLFRASRQGEFDELPEPFERGDYLLRLKLGRKGLKGAVGETLQRLCTWAKEKDYSQLHVRFTDQNKSDHTLKLDTEDAKILNPDDFVRRETVDLGQDEQPTSVLEIREDGQLLSHMLRLGPSCFTDSSRRSATSL